MSQARKGSLLDEPFERVSFPVSGTGLCFEVIRGGRWASPHVLSLESHLESAAPYGVLVAVPARDEALFHHIQSDKFVDIGVAMVRHAVRDLCCLPTAYRSRSLLAER